ncbi:MAG TPA: hypothetical protein VK952_05715, partial [Methylotenera sp.]|nr:hypothetical protein [Methylotenera sp.]
VYRMKKPFEGELAECDEGFSSTVGYGKNMISSKSAGLKICELVAMGMSKRCENNGVEIIFNAIQRDAQGRLKYKIIARVRVAAHPELTVRSPLGHVVSVPVEYEERIYSMDIEGKDWMMTDQSWMLCGGPCKRLDRPTSN